MALSRRGGARSEGPIWPGFVDAMTSLLLVLLFVLTIFMMVQSVLRETITSQGDELDALNAQVAELADALGLEQTRAEGLQQEVGRLGSALTQAEAEGEAQAAAILSLNSQLAAREAELGAAAARISDFEAQVAALLAERDAAQGTVASLQAEAATLRSEQDALNAALAAARSEIDAQTEAARLAAARRDALEALTAELQRKTAEAEVSLSDALARLQAADGLRARLTAERDRLTEEVAALGDASAEAEALRRRVAEVEASLTEAERARLAEAAAAEALRKQLATSEGALSEAERARLADLAAAEALRKRLAEADDELTAMTLALEESRKRAEETLTLLAAADAAKVDAGKSAALNAGLLDAARKVLTEKDQTILQERRRVALLNEQIKALRAQLGSLQALLDASGARDAEARVQVEALGSQLNAALAQVASETSRRLALEEAERRRLEAEKENLEKFRSEFFGQLSQLLAGREGVRVVGDRFVFSSEVLFNPGSADLAPEGQEQIRSVVQILDEVAEEIPPAIDWIIRVDGHTDNVPLSGTGEFRDNWQLSQARALSVVRYMQEVLRFPPERMAATGFGEWQPVASGDSPAARAANRRIEMKLTDR